MNINNPKTLRKSNMANIAFELLTNDALSRLQLASKLQLTTASITQLVHELISKGIVYEDSSIQRNQTGRKEILLKYNEPRFTAISVNIETDKTHVSLCSYNNVIFEKIVSTAELDMQNGNLAKLNKLIYEVLDTYKTQHKIIGIGIGIVGIVDEETGDVVNSYGILPKHFMLKEKIHNEFKLDTYVINNIRAQARSLIRNGNDGFLYIKHAPGLGAALVINGRLINGDSNVAGEIGHIVLDRNGKKCSCGKSGCLETIVSESAIIKDCGGNLKIDEIYKMYGKDEKITNILNAKLDLICRVVCNTMTIVDPVKVVLTGGLFLIDGLKERFIQHAITYYFKDLSQIVFLDNTEKIKAFAEARHVILNKIFEV